MIKVALAGSVSSSLVTLEKLIEHQLEVVYVLGYEPESTALVSGYQHLKPLCDKNNIPYVPFLKINQPEHVRLLQEAKPDVFFVVGLSQLVSEELLSIPKLGCIGFHPTLLPRGRGRAPIAWLLLNEKQGAANFFLMGQGADDGPIFVQEPFDVTELDDAATIEEKILQAIKIGLDKWLPSLNKGEWNPIPQNDAEATYYGKRGPEDGWVNWDLPAYEIDRLIRASAPPHPGAYSFLKANKVIITKSRIEKDIPIKGVVGRVLIKNEQGEALIQCGSGLVWINALNAEGNPVPLSVGQKLGYYAELEIYNLKKQIEELKKLISV